jgi:hypothetical protein
MPEFPFWTLLIRTTRSLLIFIDRREVKGGCSSLRVGRESTCFYRLLPDPEHHNSPLRYRDRIRVMENAHILMDPQIAKTHRTSKAYVFEIQGQRFCFIVDNVIEEGYGFGAIA